MLFMLPQVFWLASQGLAADRRPRGTRDSACGNGCEAAFRPGQLTVEDESHLHAGHAGAADGHSHFRIRIVAEAFRGISSVARHRLVYAAVDDLMKNDIHALAIEALPPET